MKKNIYSWEAKFIAMLFVGLSILTIELGAHLNQNFGLSGTDLE